MWLRSQHRREELWTMQRWLQWHTMAACYCGWFIWMQKYVFCLKFHSRTCRRKNGLVIMNYFVVCILSLLVCRQGLIRAHCFVLQSVTAMAMLRNADSIQLHLLILILLVVVSVSTVCITLLVVNVRSVSLCIFRIHPKTLEIQLLVFVSPVQVFWISHCVVRKTSTCR